MSKEDIERFQQAFLTYTTIQEGLKAITDRDSFVEMTVELGKERECNFTAQEVESLIDEHLKTEELVSFATIEEAIEQFQLPKQQPAW